MRYFKTFMSLALLFIGFESAMAGVIVGGTRVIYPSDKKEVSLMVKNPDKATDYLIQSWIDNFDEANKTKVPFIITPPLFRLDRESENILRIADTGANLPADRESIFWLSVKSIAAIPKEKKDNRLQIVVRTRIKLIYRPTSLNNDEARDAYQKLTFTRQGGELVIKNPTPYYVSFYSLKVAGKTVDNPGMVAPFGEHLVTTASNGAIEWQAVNDYGGNTQAARQ
uniref:fimbrial biogenesis chaperone n=1 Tax=Serratia proteamaculans TaxID=28151 RepID=UPI001F4BE9CD|nr:molecular chaperone [Serratia proteamaculans]ULG17710.1 fimbrial assembly protein [Serratia proteamaculans]